MSKAPERIWAETYDQLETAGRWTSEPRFPERPTVYIRADLAGLPEDLIGRLKTCRDAGPSYHRLHLIVTDILAWHEQRTGGGE